MTNSHMRPFRELGLQELRLQLDAVHSSEEEQILSQRRALDDGGATDARWVDAVAQARFQQAKLAALLCRSVGDACRERGRREHRRRLPDTQPQHPARTSGSMLRFRQGRNLPR